VVDGRESTSASGRAASSVENVRTVCKVRMRASMRRAECPVNDQKSHRSALVVAVPRHTGRDFPAAMNR
jgi:hypothetical protein